MPAQIQEAIKGLGTQIVYELDRVIVDLSSAKPTDSQGIQSAITKLNALKSQLSAVNHEQVANGVLPLLVPTEVTAKNPVKKVEDEKPK